MNVTKTNQVSCVLFTAIYNMEIVQVNKTCGLLKEESLRFNMCGDTSTRFQTKFFDFSVYLQNMLPNINMEQGFCEY